MKDLTNYFMEFAFQFVLDIKNRFTKTKINMKNLKQMAVLMALSMSTLLSAQVSGTIKGTITDDKGGNLPMVTVALMEDSTLISAISTDNNGDFTFRLLTPGMYNLKFSFIGFKTMLVNSVEVSPNITSYVYWKMTTGTTELGGTEVFADAWVKPIVDNNFSAMQIISIDQIDHLASGSTDIVKIATAISPDVQPTEDGKDLYMRGSRRGTNAYYVDGNRVIGTATVPGIGISEMIVLTGGVPAEYGDCTGGLVIITTKDYKAEMRRKEIARRKKE